MTLPMRFRILHLLTLQELSENEIMAALRPEYGSEGQYRRSTIDTHLASMKAVGMIEITELSMGADGKLLHKFRATEYGRNYLKYIPKGWSPEQAVKSAAM
jgi:DNA-binding PadR family transcriptional regulator